jgi:hypothetical protein
MKTRGETVMTELMTSSRLREIVEDRLEEATGESRHVTDIEIEFIPEQDEDHNWSSDAKCKREYRAALYAIVDDLEEEFPVIDFA